MNTDESEVYAYQESQRGTRGRFRGTSRGPQRTRASGDRTMQSRGGRARMRSYNARDLSRDSPRVSAPVQESLDINDSSQWPSIQESATGRVSKRRSRGERVQNTQDNHGSNSVRVSEASPSARAQNAESQSEGQKIVERPQGNQNEQPHISGQREERGRTNRDQSTEYNNYSNYPPQPYWYNPRGGRGRARYTAHPQNRGYQFQYPRRYNRGYSHVYQQHPANVIPYPPVENQAYVNGYISPYPVQVPPMDEKTKEYEAMRQVEYYFSAQNLGSDTFMRARMDREGWIDLSLVFKFKRIQRLDMTYDDFLKAVSASDQLEVNKMENRVRTIHNPTQWILDKSSSEKITQGERTEVQPAKPTAHVQMQQPQIQPPVGVGAPMVHPQPMYPHPRPSARFFGTFSFVPQPYYPYQYPEGEPYYPPYFHGMPPMYPDPNYAGYYEQIPPAEEASTQDAVVASTSNPSEERAAKNDTTTSEIKSEVAHTEDVEKLVSGISNLKVESSGTTSGPSPTPTPST